MGKISYFAGLLVCKIDLKSVPELSKHTLDITKIPCYLYFRVLVRAVSYTIHGLIPASCVFADRYNREEVVASLGREINLNPPLTLGQLPDTSEELLKLDQVLIRFNRLKVLVFFRFKYFQEICHY